MGYLQCRDLPNQAHRSKQCSRCGEVRLPLSQGRKARVPKFAFLLSTSCTTLQPTRLAVFASKNEATASLVPVGVLLVSSFPRVVSVWSIRTTGQLDLLRFREAEPPDARSSPRHDSVGTGMCEVNPSESAYAGRGRDARGNRKRSPSYIILRPTKSTVDN